MRNCINNTNKHYVWQHNVYWYYVFASELMAAPTETITISQFKATCLAVLDKVKRTGQPVLVTRRGEPIALIDPPPLPKRKASWLGSFSSQGKITGDIVSPVLPESDWEVLNE